MASRAEKLRSKRASRSVGRPRKEGVDRYPSGDIKRHETEKDVLSVALEARQRIHGLSENNALAGYTLGRMFLDGAINEEQRKAGDDYAEIISRYHRLVGIPYPSARAQSLFTVKGHDGEVTESLAKRARDASNRMMEVEGILLRCVDGPQVKGTVYNLCVMDYDHLRGMAPQQLLWLKRGLNALLKSKELREKGKSVMSWDIPFSELSPV
jgi:hypothetical protein